MKNITDRQREVLVFIAQFTEEHVYPPTVREIGEHFSISLRAVQDHIAALQKKGYLALSPKHSRSIRVLRDLRENHSGSYTARIPVVRVTAPEKPILSDENCGGMIYCADPFIEPGERYAALTMPDSSMQGVGILAGDTAIVHLDAQAQDGQLVATMVGDSLTVRRLRNEAERVCLQPENPDFQPVYSKEARLAGVIAGIIRSC